MAGISKQAVSQALRRSGLDPEEIGRFKKDKSLILHGKQKILLDALTPEVVKGMSGRDKIVSFGIVYDKTRLEDDKSTANILSFVKTSDLLEPYRNQECTACRAWTTGVEAGLCPTCRTDIEARKATAAAAALPAPTAEGGTDHDIS